MAKAALWTLMVEPPSDDPFRSLLDDHEDFADKLTELEATLDEMMETRVASEENVELLEEAVRFFQDEVFPHFEREERSVLPRLEAKVGLYGSLVNVVAYEHAEIRRGVEKIQESIDALKAKRGGPHGAEIEEVNRHGLFAVQVLWDHFRKERMSLFPTARQELSPEELGRIREELRAA